MTINVVLADNYQMLREAFRTLLQCHPSISILGETDNGKVAIELTQQLQPDVLILDVKMPGIDGLEATREIKSKVPDTRILALSMYTDEEFIVKILKAGASGYLQTDCAFEELILAVKTVYSGRFYLGRAVTDQVVRKKIVNGN